MATEGGGKGNNSGPASTVLLRYAFLCVALPYMIGYLVSSSSLSLDLLLPLHPVGTGLERLLGPLLSSGLGRRLIASIKDDGSGQQQRTAALDEHLDICFGRLLDVILGPGNNALPDNDPFAGVSIVMHRNGESIPCGQPSSTKEEGEKGKEGVRRRSNSVLLESFRNTLEDILDSDGACPPADAFADKYYVEAVLTTVFHELLSATCYSVEEDSLPDEGFYGYCDMGDNKTPILPDHDKLVQIESTWMGQSASYLPCHFHNRHGVRVTSLQQLAQLAQNATSNRQSNNNSSNSAEHECQVTPEGACAPQPPAGDGGDDRLGQDPRELHLYAVPAGRVFMFAPSHVGEIIDLPHVTGADPTQPVYLRVLSLSPRVFDLVNFFTKKQSAELVERALHENRESHRIKRSSTGAIGYNINKHRTSESGYDTDGEVAMEIKRRCFDVLGFDEYIESHADGIQILRYNLTTAYNTHMDWIEVSNEADHDFQSAEKGGNRFATILLYMTDLNEGEGGETVFKNAWPPGQPEEEHVEIEEALQALRRSGDASVLQVGSWEEKLVAECRSRLAIRPVAGRAVLFYSQLPNGQEDKASLHGGCPTLRGTKYAANLWVWNTPRQGYPGSPRNPKNRQVSGGGAKVPPATSGAKIPG